MSFRRSISSSTFTPTVLPVPAFVPSLVGPVDVVDARRTRVPAVNDDAARLDLAVALRAGGEYVQPVVLAALGPREEAVGVEQGVVRLAAEEAELVEPLSA